MGGLLGISEGQLNVATHKFDAHPIGGKGVRGIASEMHNLGSIKMPSLRGSSATGLEHRE